MRWANCCNQSQWVAGRLADVDDEIDLSKTVFIDTETTGLAGGTGTLAFLIGVGTFEEDGSFVVRQFFMRSPAEEPARAAASVRMARSV